MRQTKLIIAALLVFSPLAANADPIEWTYDLFEYESNFSSWQGFSDGDSFGFGFAESTNFNAIVENDLLSIFYEIDGIRYDSTTIFNMKAEAFTSRFTYDGLTLSYHDVFNAPAGGNGLGGNDWQWIRSLDAGDGSDQIWMASGVNTTFYAVIDNVSSYSISHVAGSNRHDIYSGTSFSVPEPGTLALFGLGLLGMAARRKKKV